MAWALVGYLTEKSAIVGVDASRLALWSCSSNVRRGLPLAESLAPAVRAAVVYYGWAEVSSFRGDLPLLIARAGLDSPSLDSPSLNLELDALVARALVANAPVEVLNVATGGHGFDIRNDAEPSRAAIARTLDFLATTVTGGLGGSVPAGPAQAAASAAVSLRPPR